MIQNEKEDSKSKPKFKEETASQLRYRRTALLEGACGQAGRVNICGQVVDLSYDKIFSEEEWDHFHNLPKKKIKKEDTLETKYHQKDWLPLGSIRAIEDLTMPSVRQARLQLEILKAKPNKFSSIETSKLQNAPLIWTSAEFQTRNNGFFALLLPDHLPEGSYTVRVILRGIASARQSLADLRYLRELDSQILKKDIAIGYGSLVILAPDFTGYQIISDIDQTFLDTKIETKTGLLNTLTEKATEKKTITSMVDLYQKLTQKDGNHTSLIFLSASPHFFRRTFQSLFAHSNIELHGLYLKYLTGVIDNISSSILKLAKDPFSILSGRDIRSSMEGGMKFISTHVLSLFDQVGYKLEMLLRNRLMQPTLAKEILIGDNSESDFLIFTLYQAFLLGKCQREELEEYFSQFNFEGREAITTKNAKTICELVEKNMEIHGTINPVRALWINHVREDRNILSLQKQIEASSPKGLQKNLLDPDSGIIPFRLCEKGIGMALAAFDEDLISQKECLLILDRSQSTKEELKMILNRFLFLKKKEINIDDFQKTI